LPLPPPAKDDAPADAGGKRLFRRAGNAQIFVFRSPWNEFSFEANFFPIGISQHAVDLLGETGILSARARLQISARRGQFQSASRL
jgi:hypothetical protein